MPSPEGREQRTDDAVPAPATDSPSVTPVTPASAPSAQPAPPSAPTAPSASRRPASAASPLDATEGQAADNADGSGDSAGESAPVHTDRNWMGLASVITGALLLSVVAIVLGHLGLAAARRGRADNRRFSIAGLILGYVGLVATGVGAWLLFASGPTPAQVDVQAQQDVSAVGAAAATVAVESNRVPDVVQTADGYTVDDRAIPAELTTPHELVMVAEGRADWCLEITYEGGEQPAFSYTATGGMAPGRC